MEKFLKEIIDILDSENEIGMDSYLDKIEEWDSLGVISFVSMVNIKYGRQVQVEDIKRSETVFDLYKLVVGEQE